MIEITIKIKKNGRLKKIAPPGAPAPPLLELGVADPDIPTTVVVVPPDEPNDENENDEEDARGKVDNGKDEKDGTGNEKEALEEDFNVSKPTPNISASYTP